MNEPHLFSLQRLVVTMAIVGSFVVATSSAGPPAAQRPMGAPIDGLTPGQLARFQTGRMDYQHTFLPAEGLGPIFNQNSCASCHNNPVGGTGSITVTRAGVAEKFGFDGLESLGGSLFQQEAIDDDCREDVPAHANVVALRVTNGMMGYGLVEAIPDADILALIAGQPSGQQGVAHMVGAFEDPPASPLHVGRFGWKAQLATILSFSADAAQNEIGLSNRFIPFDNDPNGIMAPDLGDCDSVPDPEDGPDGAGLHFIDRVTDFQRYLAPPPQTPKSGMTGEAVFNAIGCAVCHHTSFTTANDPSLEVALRDRTIQPYSDFLLHDMGLASDFIAQGDATEREIRTPPLWGVRRRDPMWHDGRFVAGTFEQRITDAILEHGASGSQGTGAASAFGALPQPDKDALFAFLDSLGRREFDHDGDDDVTLADFLAMTACTATGAPISPDDACAVSDLDQDGDVDADDLTGFWAGYFGPMADCNNNGVVDLIDIFSGASPDANTNGVPDECEPTCHGDLVTDGAVNVQDLLRILTEWGSCPERPLPCRSDLNFDGHVDVDDLLQLLVQWGPCS